MSQLQELVQDIRKYNEEQKRIEQTKAGKLVKKITSGKKTNEEWLGLEKEVQKFLQSDAPEEEKKMVSGYTEMLGMICSGIKKSGE
uniref:hypothetical protein n=1 Tax=Acetatifactor sp. TaxID=1872090 RepID=UPI004057A444